MKFGIGVHAGAQHALPGQDGAHDAVRIEQLLGHQGRRRPAGPLSSGTASARSTPIGLGHGLVPNWAQGC